MSRIIAFAAISLVSPACVQVEADVPSACFLQTDVTILSAQAEQRLEEGRALAEEHGVDVPAQFAPELDTETTFVRDGLEEIPQSMDDVGVESDIRLSFIDVRATKGLSSFEGIERVGLRISPTDPRATLQPLELPGCVAADGCDTSTDEVRLHGRPDVDLLPYLEEGSLAFTLVIGGALPVDAWTFDVDVCMAAKGKMQRSL